MVAGTQDSCSYHIYSPKQSKINTCMLTYLLVLSSIFPLLHSLGTTYNRLKFLSSLYLIKILLHSCVHRPIQCKCKSIVNNPKSPSEILFQVIPGCVKLIVKLTTTGEPRGVQIEIPVTWWVFLFLYFQSCVDANVTTMTPLVKVSWPQYCAFYNCSEILVIFWSLKLGLHFASNASLPFT